MRRGGRGIWATNLAASGRQCVQTESSTARLPHRRHTRARAAARQAAAAREEAAAREDSLRAELDHERVVQTRAVDA